MFVPLFLFVTSDDAESWATDMSRST